jgi:hypothetical protein
MAKANPKLEGRLSEYGSRSRIRGIFRRIRRFFPRDDYLLRSIHAAAQSRGSDATYKKIYTSLKKNGNAKIPKEIEAAALDLEQQIKNHNYHDKNLFPLGLKETTKRIKQIYRMGQELRDWHQFKSVKAIAQCLEERVSTEEMPVTADYIFQLLVGRLQSITTPEAYRTYLEMETMLHNAKRGKPEAVPFKYVVLNKKRTPSEPLDVFIGRALKELLGTDAAEDVQRVYGALEKFRRVSQLDTMVREIAKGYGFETNKSAYDFLYNLADLGTESKKGIARPINVNRKLYAAAWILHSVPEDQRSQIAIDKKYLVVGREVYKRPIGQILGYGFTPTIAATMLWHKLDASRKKGKSRRTVKFLYSMYIYAVKHNATYGEHTAMQELADRLKNVYVVDLRHPGKEKEFLDKFDQEYRDDKSRCVPVIVMLGKRKIKDGSTLNKIREEAEYRFQNIYMSTAYRGYAKKHHYSPFSDFIKLIRNRPNPPR